MEEEGWKRAWRRRGRREHGRGGVEESMEEEGWKIPD
jgi:hypothetical protein